MKSPLMELLGRVESDLDSAVAFLEEHGFTESSRLLQLAVDHVFDVQESLTALQEAVPPVEAV